jgi:hypothetical protein
MVAPRQIMKAGTRSGFVPMHDVTQFWEKPNKLVVLNKAKVKRVIVFGFGHLGDQTCAANFGRRVVAELPLRYPDLYPPWKPCKVGTYDCLVSHGARITLLQSPNSIRCQHLGPWAIKTMRGVIQGFIDGKRKMIPGTVRDLFGNVDGVTDTQLAPLDTVLDLTRGMEALGIGHQEGVQAGLLGPKEVATVVVHDDYMLPPGMVQVPPWSRCHHEGFNGVVTSFRKGFLSGMRGARITIGAGWPGYDEGRPKPFKTELVSKMWPYRHKFPPEHLDRAVEAVEDQLRALQQRWKIVGAAEPSNKWQSMPISPAAKEADAARLEKQATIVKDAMAAIVEAREKVASAEAELAVGRRRLIMEAKKAHRDLLAAHDGVLPVDVEQELKRTRRSRLTTFKKDMNRIIRRGNRTIRTNERLIRGAEPPKERTNENTPDRLLGQPELSPLQALRVKRVERAKARAAMREEMGLFSRQDDEPDRVSEQQDDESDLDDDDEEYDSEFDDAADDDVFDDDFEEGDESEDDSWDEEDVKEVKKTSAKGPAGRA